jgi:HSP20 family protein
MAIVHWEPRNRVSNPWHGFDRFFDNFLYRDSEKEDRSWLPSVDIGEDKNTIVIHADLPGIDQKDIKVTVDNDILTLQGERTDEKKDEDRGYHRLERRFGTFQRSFTLPAGVDSKKIAADYKDGVLTVKLPKTEEAKPKEIEIKVN